MTRYDDVPYPALVHPATDPSQIAAIGRLFGVPVVDPESARVLDVGCGIGANTHSLAAMFPNAEFVGMDLASSQIAIAEDIASKSRLCNTRWICGDVMQPQADWGDFDVIILHGLVSWVPQQVRDACWSLCRNHLREGGIALVSYNTYPGWHSKQVLREALQAADLMLCRERDAKPQARFKGAMDLVTEWMSKVPRESVYGKMLRDELQRVQDSEVDYLLHEFFEPVNDPVLFRDLHEQVEASGLRFVNESDWTSQRVIENDAGLSEQLKGTTSRVEIEQTVDFLLGRRFRSSLLCRADNELLSVPDWKRAFDMWLGLVGTLQNDAPAGSLRFRCEDGSLVSVSDPNAVSLVEYVSNRVPLRLRVSELADANASWDLELVRRLTVLGVMNVYASPVSATNGVEPKPRTSDLVRYQASRSETVSSAVHRNVKLDRATRWLLELCDGTRTLGELAEGVTARSVQAGIRLPGQDGSGVQDERKRLRQAVTASLPSRLESLAKAGLLWRTVR